MNEVTYETLGHVAVVTLNRPDQRNAVNLAVTEALRAAIDRAEADSNVRCVVLTGAGKVFCAGMDLKAHLAGETDKVLFGEGGFAGFVARKRDLPVIAAVEGAALAGGFEIMLACDLAVAASDAVFGLPEPKIGLIAGAGGAIRLAQRIPRVLANEMLLTGEVIGAAQAQGWGLVNRVVETGTTRATAIDLAEKIAANAPGAVRASLALSRQAIGQTEESAWAMNDAVIGEIGGSTDAREGITAFLEKRAPRWSS